jgi:hypothetical protein
MEFRIRTTFGPVKLFLRNKESAGIVSNEIVINGIPLSCNCDLKFGTGSDERWKHPGGGYMLDRRDRTGDTSPTMNIRDKFTDQLIPEITKWLHDNPIHVAAADRESRRQRAENLKQEATRLREEASEKEQEAEKILKELE